MINLYKDLWIEQKTMYFQSIEMPLEDQDVGSQVDGNNSSKKISVKIFSHPSIAKNIIVRDEYEQCIQYLENAVKKRKYTFSIIGQPGIGKSIFLQYILVNRLAKREPTAWQLSKETFIIFSKKGYKVTTMWQTEDYESLKEEGPTTVMWALSDSNDLIITPHEEFQKAFRSSFFVVQAASPKRERYHEWLKQANSGNIYVMKSWSWFEIKILCNILEQNYNMELVRDIYTKYTSSARIFDDDISNDTLKALESDLQKAISTLDTSYIDPRLASPLKEDADKSSRLFSLEPESDSERHMFSTPFATKYVEKCIFDYCITKSFQEQERLYTNLSKIPNGKSASGYIFEKHMHEQLSLPNVKFDILDLKCDKITGSFNSRPQRVEFSQLEDLSSEIILDHYLKPCLSNMATIDSLAIVDNVVYCFQCTVADHHSRKNKGFDIIADAFSKLKLSSLLPYFPNKGTKWRLIAVIPKKIPKFTFVEDKAIGKRKWDDKCIEEGVLVLPYSQFDATHRVLDSSSDSNVILRISDTSSIESSSNEKSAEVNSTSNTFEGSAQNTSKVATEKGHIKKKIKGLK